jgi:hypothetical protein
MISDERRRQIEAPLLCVQRELLEFARDVGGVLTRGKTDRAGHRQIAQPAASDGVQRSLFIVSLFPTEIERASATSWKHLVSVAAWWDDEDDGIRFSVSAKSDPLDPLPHGTELQSLLRKLWSEVDRLTAEDLRRLGTQSPLYPGG